MHIHLDPVGGLAGDMFAAAMLDAFPDLADPLFAALSGLERLAGVECRIAPHRDHVLTGSRFTVTRPNGHGSGKPHGAEPHHHSTPFRLIRSELSESGLSPEVKARAIAIFEILAEAEAKVHGGDIEDVSFHEVGSWDSVADIVAAAFLVDAAGSASWSIGPLPLGSGRVESAHGLLAVPAPAVVLLLEGFAVYDDGLPGERVTPTGAAIARHLNCAARIGNTPRVLSRSGTGFGTRTFENVSNILRVLAFEDRDEESRTSDQVAVLSFEIDDQTGEDLAVALAHLREQPGVIQVTQAPGIGKKGRMLAHVQVLARPDCQEEVARACLAETTTLGVRCQIASRLVLDREEIETEIDGQQVRVKTARRPDGRKTAKAEMDDIDREPRSRPQRQALRQAAEKNVLSERKR